MRVMVKNKVTRIYGPGPPCRLYG